MNFSPNKEKIREYLLGLVTDEPTLAALEELLFADEEFCNEVQITEDELINDYVFGRLDRDEAASFEQTLANNPERRRGVHLAAALKEKAKTAPVPAAQKVGFFESIAAFFKRPQFAAGFAVALIGIVIFSYLIISRRATTNEIAELQAVYNERRQTDTRISRFDHTPKTIERGDDKEEERKLRPLATRLLNAVETDPSAINRHNLGLFYLISRDFENAIPELELAVKAEPSNAGFHNDLGSAYYEAGKANIKRPENLALSVAEFTTALELKPDLLEALFNKSRALQEQGNPNQAKESWNLYLQKDPSSKWAEEARENLQKLEKLQSNLKTKEQVLNEFLAAYKAGDKELAWRINSGSRDVLAGIWLPDQLARRYMRAKLKDDTSEAKESIDAISYIGDLEKERNADFFVADLAAALSPIDKNAAKKLDEAYGLFDQGLLSIKKQDNKLALESFERGERLFTEAQNTPAAKFTAHWTMQALKYLTRADEALKKSADLMELTDIKRYRWLHASVECDTGIILVFRNELSRGMDHYVRSLAVSKALEDPLLEWRVSVVIVEALIETGEYTKALYSFYPGAQEIYFNGKQALWRDKYFFARILLKLKMNKAAVEFAAESLSVARITEAPSNVISSLVLLNEANLADGKKNEALVLAEEAAALLEKMPDNDAKLLKMANILTKTGDLKSDLRRCDEGLRDYDHAIEILKRIPEARIDRYSPHRGRLMCFKDLGRTADVSAELKDALSFANEYRSEVLNDESRQAFFNNEQAVFDIAIENSLDLGDETEAFHRAEGSKARSLLDMISRVSTEPDKKGTYQVTEPYSLDEIRSKIPANSQIVEYSLLKDRLAIWVISSGGQRTADLRIDVSRLNAAIRELTAVDKTPGPAETKRAELAKELYELLIDPIFPHLDPTKNLVIVPDKTLYFVPFASLLNKDGRYLIERFTLSYSPSSTIFISNNSRRVTADAHSEKLLAVGNPAFDRRQYPRLAELDSAEEEARQIASMAGNSTILTGAAATKEKFLLELPQASAVHFAGHFVSNPATPDLAKMIFAARDFDSDLRMSEIAGRKLPRLRLVVLSACETGIDNVLEGEGSISASRAFLAAGTSTVVASQWKVDSDATENLMVAFHRNRLKTDMNLAEALRQAQLEMINNPNGKFTAPYYWAAFYVIGGLEK